MKTIAQRAVLILQAILMVLLFSGCNDSVLPDPAENDAPHELTPGEAEIHSEDPAFSLNDAIAFIENDVIKSASDVFYSQFSPEQGDRTAKGLRNKSAATRYAASGSSRSLPDLSDGYETDLDGDIYTLIGDQLIVEYDPSGCDTKKEDLPCDQFDAFLEQYKRDIIMFCEQQQNSDTPLGYVDAEGRTMWRITITENNGELLYRSYFGSEWSREADYTFYHSYEDSEGRRRIDLASCSLYTAARISDIDLGKTNFFKGYSLQVIDGKYYHYQEYYVDDRSLPDGRTIEIVSDENGDVEMTTMINSNGTITIVDEVTQEFRDEPAEIYEISVFRKCDENTFCSVGRTETVTASDEWSTDSFILYHKDGYQLWDEDAYSLSFGERDIQSSDRIRYLIADVNTLSTLREHGLPMRAEYGKDIMIFSGESMIDLGDFSCYIRRVPGGIILNRDGVTIIIPKLEIMFYIPFREGDALEQVVSVFRQNGISYRGFSDLQDLIDYYNGLKTVLPIDIDKDYLLTLCRQNAETLLSVFDNFEIDDIDRYLEELKSAETEQSEETEETDEIEGTSES